VTEQTAYWCEQERYCGSCAIKKPGYDWDYDDAGPHNPDCAYYLLLEDVDWSMVMPQSKKLFRTDCADCETVTVWWEKETVEETEAAKRACPECHSSNIRVYLDNRCMRHTAPAPRGPAQQTPHTPVQKQLTTGGLADYAGVSFTMKVEINGGKKMEITKHTKPVTAPTPVVCNPDCPACLYDEDRKCHTCAVLSFAEVTPLQDVCKPGRDEILRRLQVAEAED
jgi:hypothetical protein